MSYTPLCHKGREFEFACDLLAKATGPHTPEIEWALRRIRKNTTTRAPNKALPMTPARAAQCLAMRSADPHIRLQDIAIQLNVAPHDVSCVVNGARP